VFIEVTATDLTKAEVALNTICTMFFEYCGDKFSTEMVEVIDAAGKSKEYPVLSHHVMAVNTDYIISGVGAKDPPLTPDSIGDLLKKMGLASELSSDPKNLKVFVPPTRSDILHACDIMEDVAIAYGYSNLKIVSPNTNTRGKQNLLNKVSTLIRREVAFAGFTETLTLVLCGREENYKFLRRTDDGLAVTLANPKTIEFQIARTTLLVGLLKTVQHNRNSTLPIKIFEVSDVVLMSNNTDVGAKNQRNLCAIYCSQTPGFEIIHGLLDYVMSMNRVTWKERNSPVNPEEKHYYLQPSEDPVFLSGRSADIILNEKKVGVIGIIHPEVLEKYEIPFLCSALEIDIEPFL